MYDRVANIMKVPEQIRNIATSAHIHHGKCVSPETRLCLADGRFVTAEELFANAEQNGLKVQEYHDRIVYDVTDERITAFALNKETGQIEKKNISHAWKLKGGNAIKITLRNGANITTTPEHKYIVLEDMEFVEKEACDLQLKDRVVCARKLDTITSSNLKNDILDRLSTSAWYACMNKDYGVQLKENILVYGLKRLATELKVREKSLYHGVWQNRYKIEHLLHIARALSLDNIYDHIERVTFRNNTKSTSSLVLPQRMEDLFFLAGLFFGDGSGHKFVVGKPVLAEECQRICNSLGIKTVIRQQEKRTPELHANKALSFLLNTLFDYPLRKKSHNIKVNDFVSQAPKECIAKFLQAYFDCDGTVEHSRRAISLTSVSEKMLRDVQLLLLRFGCVSINQGDTLYISGMSARNFQDHIGFSLVEKHGKAQTLADKTQGSQVVDTVPLSQDKLVSVRDVPMASLSHHYYKYEKKLLTPTVDTLMQIQEQFAAQELVNPFAKLTTGDLAFVSVQKIEHVEEPIVYDFTVPYHHNFIAEGMVIHNTAFTDNLLAAAGLMSEAAAGSLDKGMATWQHADEQERLMTVDSANVSMCHTYDEKEYLINLIDTPGHVDFGGNVTRAMRAIDGTVVLVCASEGIMPQTETVLKQALRERVKPVLFINKVDRLIKEMQYTPEQIQERFIKIIKEFNRLVEGLAEDEFKEEWQASIQDGSVAFGSARDNWGMSLTFMQKNKVSMKDILAIYEMEKEEREKWIWKNAPLFQIILDMVIKHLPNPKEAQKYRISRIWKGDLESAQGKDLLTCNPSGKTAYCITRILIDLRSGREICAGRLYSGTIKEGMEVYCSGSKNKQRIQNVYMYIGVKTEAYKEVPAGNVLAVAGVNVQTGETLLDSDQDTEFEELKHIFEPVISKAIEVEKVADLPKLVEVLRKTVKEDPSLKVDINEETGEVLVHGMGELHLEIVENRIITEKNVKVKTSPPIVVYREAITKPSPQAEGKSPNKHNRLYFEVQPLDDGAKKLIKDGLLSEGRTKKKDLEMREKLQGVGWDTKDCDAVKDIFNGNMFLDKTRGIVQIGEIMEMVLDMFEDIMKNGPLAKEPCIGVKVVLKDCKLHEDAIHRGPAQMYPAVREGIRGAMMQAGPVLFEPLQIHVIEGPVDNMGDISKLVANKRGQLLEMNQQGVQVVCKAKLPVGEMLGWSSDLRSATNGRGTSALLDQDFEKLPNELQEKIRGQIVSRKGLKESQLGA